MELGAWNLEFVNNLAKIEEIYHAALGKSPFERAAFLKESCGDDVELRFEVESLLSFDEQAADFIETPPEDVAAAIFAKKRDENLIGKTLNHYCVLSILGAGGMGEVYLAEDTKLGRKVALKLLPQQFSTDAERKARFEQEARAASALNHPNIIPIYGIETAENLDFIVTELVEGKTLRERITEKPFSWQETLEIAQQITSALEAAHAVGIVHRDIKPANIMIRRDGFVKILDFGLAKLTMPNTDSGSFETRDQTAPNRVMGTLNYMSPEQALGEKVDARTDIFSIGVVLYEMLSGIQPFAGASDAAIYNATINKNPPLLSESNTEIPFELDLIIKRAIAKNRNERYQTAENLRLDLQTFKQDSSAANFVSLSAKPSKSNFAKLIYPLAALVLAISAIVYFAFFAKKSETNQPDVAKHFNFSQFTTSGNAVLPSLAPDGKTMIFSSRQSGNWDIYFQRVGGANAINLTKDSASDDLQAVYSPNGEQIAFRSDRDGGGLFVMGATGENIRKISDFGYHPAWSPDGKEIAFSATTFEDPTDRGQFPAALWAVNIASGEKRELTKGDAVQPSWSPNGERIAFWGIDNGGIRDIKTVSSKGGDEIFVTKDAALDWNPVWSPDGKYLYFASNRGGSMNFWRVSIDEKSGKTLGEPEPFTTPSTFSQNLTFSANGKILAYVQKTNSMNIIESEFNPNTETLSKKTTEITNGAKINRNPSVSPDGEFLAFDAIKDKQEDLFICKRDGSNLLQLTNDINKDRAPRWSPDGKKLMFYSDRSGKYESWTIKSDGSGLSQFSFDSEPYGMLSFWSPDGKKILQNVNQNYPKIFDAEKPFTEQTPFQIPTETGADRCAMAYSWSPDGKKIASMRMGTQTELFGIVIYDLASNKNEELTNFGESPVWLNDNRRVIFFDVNKIYLLDTLTKKTKELMSFAPNENLQGITISSDNRFIYYSLQKKESGIWLANIE